MCRSQKIRILRICKRSPSLYSTNGRTIEINPPVIDLEDSSIAYSPDGDGSIDVALLNWSVNEQGLFTVKIYSSGHSSEIAN